MTVVVAGIVERNRKILVCQRTETQAHPLKWEFPGGKVEPGETPEQALSRELQEELAIRAQAGEEITRYRYQYPGRPPVLLIFFRVGEFHGEPENRVFREIRWEEPAKLPGLDFLDGDVEFVRRLAREC